MPGVPILVSLQADSTADGEQPMSLQLLTSGVLTLLADGYLIQYEETLDESSVPTQVELTLQDEMVTMSRCGDFQTNLVFRQGQRYEGQYATPFGFVDLAVYCTQMHMDVSEQGGFLHLQYQLDVNGQFVAMHEMDIRFAPKENNDL